jgi:outer membrane protein assembly factor BamB
VRGEAYAARLVAAALSALALAGCAWLRELPAQISTGFGLWESVDPALKPAPLPSFAPTASAGIAWKASVGPAGDRIFSPGIARDYVYAASRKGTLSRFAAEGGAPGWSLETGLPLSAGVGVGEGLVLVGTAKGEVLAYDGDGQLKWQASVKGELLAAPDAGDGVVVVRTADSRLLGLDPADGKRRWIYQRANPPLTVRSATGVVIYRGAIFAGFAGGKLVALNAASGAVGWEAAVALPKGTTELERITDITSDPVLDDRMVCAVAHQGRLSCFDILRGSLLWTRDVSSHAGLAMDQRRIFVTDDRGAVHALDKERGASLWKQDKLYARRVTAPQRVGPYVAVGDFEGYVHLLSAEDGSFAARVATDGSAIGAQPALLGDDLLVQTRNGGLFAIRVR